MQEKGAYFPLFVSLAGKRILIAGAGQVAARRAKVLISFGAKLSVTAPECSEEMAELLKEKGRDVLCYEKRVFTEEDLRDADLVLAATDDTALNHHIAKLCREKKIPVNNASDQRDCDFFFPAIVQAKGLTVGVSSGGRDHGKVAGICEELRAFFGTASQEGQEDIFKPVDQLRSAVSGVGEHKDGVGQNVPAVGLPDEE